MGRRQIRQIGESLGPVNPRCAPTGLTSVSNMGQLRDASIYSFVSSRAEELGTRMQIAGSLTAYQVKDILEEPFWLEETQLKSVSIIVPVSSPS